MVLPFSQNTVRREQNKVVQKQHELELKQRTRQKVIRDTVAQGVQLAMRRVKLKAANDTAGFEVVFRLEFWTNNSAFMLHDYRGVSREDLDNAIRTDVDYLLTVVAKLSSDYREWEIGVRYPERGSSRPNQILVRKKK